MSSGAFLIPEQFKHGLTSKNNFTLKNMWQKYPKFKHFNQTIELRKHIFDSMVACTKLTFSVVFHTKSNKVWSRLNE